MSLLDAASYVHVTWEKIVQLHILSCWICLSFSTGEDGLNAFSAVCTFLLLLYLFTCLLAFYCLHLGTPVSGSENWKANEQVISFTNKSFFSFLLDLCGNSFLFIPFLNLMKFSKGLFIFKQNVKNMVPPPKVYETCSTSPNSSKEVKF